MLTEMQQLGLDRLGQRLYDHILSAIKSTGTYDPEQNMCFFEERLTIEESREVAAFLKWCHQDPEYRSLGHGNYEDRYAQFKQWRHLELKRSKRHDN